jgi:hypothetical protein
MLGLLETLELIKAKVKKFCYIYELVKEVKKVLQGKVQSAEGRVEKIMRDVIRLVPDS